MKVLSQMFVSILRSFSGSPIHQFSLTYDLFMFITPAFRIDPGTVNEQIDGSE